MVTGRLLRFGVVILALGVPGCFFYDSRWGEQKRAQQHAAARSTPAKLLARTPGSTAEGQRTLTLRVYATPKYTAAVVDWQKQFGSQLECVNSVFAPDFGASLQVVEFKTFRPQSKEEDLHDVLREVTELDRGADVDWVVGLASSMPRLAVSADELGVAPLLGNHVVMRAMSDAHEYEAIQNGFTELSESERLKLYQVRKRHKLCTVFLHELAHTLGVPHEQLGTSLMNPRYHVEARGFSEAAARIMSASLAVRDPRSNLFANEALAKDMSQWLSAPGWEPSSRDPLLQQLASYGSPPATQQAAGPLSPAPRHSQPAASSALAKGPAIAGLTPDEQLRYEQARSELSAGHTARASELAATLLAKHADLPETQLLRCDLAMAIGGDWEQISSQCAGLSPFGSGK